MAPQTHHRAPKYRAPAVIQAADGEEARRVTQARHRRPKRPQMRQWFQWRATQSRQMIP